MLIACAILSFNSAPIFFATTYFKYISNDLTYFYYFVLFIAALTIIFSHLAPESPRYLYEKGEFDKARTVINKMATVNGSDMISENWLFKGEVPIEEQTGIQNINGSPVNVENKQLLQNNQEFGKEEIKTKMSPIKFMMKYPIIFKNLMIATIGWSCILMMLYYLNFAVKDIGRDIFTNSYLEATCVVIGKILFTVLKSIFPTRLCLMLGFIVIIIFSVLLILAQQEWQASACYSLVVAGVYGSTVLIYYLNIEYFPTLFLNFAFSFTNFVSRGCVMGSYLLSDLEPPLPMIIF